MDVAKILGAVLHDRAQQHVHGQRTVQRAVTFPQRPQGAPQMETQGPLGGLLAGVLQEAIRRNGRQLPGWRETQPPFPGAPGYPIPANPSGPYPGQGGHGHHQPCHDMQERAVVLLRAMIQAAKADGCVDAAEEQAIVGRMGHLSPQEAQFLRHEFAQPIDVHRFAHTVPQGMEADVYAASLMAIRLDTQYEGQYLIQLAQCLRLQPHIVDQIHQQLGAPCLHR